MCPLKGELNPLAALAELEGEAAHDTGTPRDANPHAAPKYAAAWLEGWDNSERRLQQDLATARSLTI